VWHRRLTAVTNCDVQGHNLRPDTPDNSLAYLIGDENVDKLWVETGGRLHLGQLDLNGSLGRLYGGLGLAIDQPRLEVVAEKSEGFCLVCPASEQERLKTIACEYLTFYGLPGVKLELVQALPSHSGFGSGTSLSLALGFAITRVYGLHPPLTELATITDREGSRSGLGVAAFAQGGLLVDGGRTLEFHPGSHRSQIPPLLARLPFPDEWSIILAMPDNERTFGIKEENAFRSLPPMEEGVSGAICRLILMKLLPGLLEKNLESFGQALAAIQEYLGSYFTPVQGGSFASAEGLRIAEYLRSQGAAGVGQSSWGPAIYGFTQREHCSLLLTRTRNYVGDPNRVWVASGRNHGASWGWR